uniref:Variant surface glycoprotein 1125.2592 n=1 Tax=Trypanosoma brucei TaxID=5691 RepID=A0A1J0R4W0_9TRYP|nr:variant surface glycoprotein 1125.2592 [Trypanosoma brucei]
MQALVAATTAATPQQDEMYSAAAVAAMQCAATALNNLQNFQAKALKAAANGGKIAGHISESVNLLAVMSKGGTTGTCIDGSGGNAPDCVNSAKQLGCPAAVLNPTADIDKLDDNEVKATGFAKYDGTSAAGSTATQKCHLLLTSGNSAGHLWQDNTPGPQELLLGLLSVTPHNSHASTAINLGTANAIATGYTPTATTKDIERMYDALVAPQKADDEGCGVTPEEVLKTVISSGKAKELIKLVRQNAKLTDKGDKNDYGAAAIQRATAGQENSQDEKIHERITTKPLTQVTATGTKSASIKDNNDPADLQRTLLLARIHSRQQKTDLQKRLQEETAKKANTATPKTTETNETFEKKGTGDKCKDGSKDGFKWDENATDKSKGDCKPKEEEKTNTAAGTGETSTGVDCSKHKTQQACESETRM